MMKFRVFLLASIVCLTGFAGEAHAQVVPDPSAAGVQTTSDNAVTMASPKTRWANYLTVGESFYLNYPEAVGMGSILFSTGAQINGLHFIGIETGYTRRQSGSSEEAYSMMFPIGIAYKVKFSDRRFSPFAGLSVLYLAFPSDGVLATGLARPSIGVNFRTKRSIEFQLCATYDFTIEKPDVYVNDGVMMMHHGLGISLGMSFWGSSKGDTFKEDYYKPKKNARFRTF